MKESFEAREERINLEKELRLCELMLKNKNLELKNETTKNVALTNHKNKINRKNEEIKKEIEKLTKLLKEQNKNNKSIENENQKKAKERDDLYQKYCRYIPKPKDKEDDNMDDVDEEYEYI